MKLENADLPHAPDELRQYNDDLYKEKLGNYTRYCCKVINAQLAEFLRDEPYLNRIRQLLGVNEGYPIDYNHVYQKKDEGPVKIEDICLAAFEDAVASFEGCGWTVEKVERMGRLRNIIYLFREVE